MCKQEHFVQLNRTSPWHTVPSSLTRFHSDIDKSVQVEPHIALRKFFAFIESKYTLMRELNVKH